VSSCTANYRPVLSSEKAPYTKRAKTKKIKKSGHIPQKGARHRDELGYWPSVANSTSNYTLQSASLFWCQAPIWDQWPIFILFVLIIFRPLRLCCVRPFWREVGSVVYSCCWASPVQSLSCSSPTGLRTIFYCLKFETPPTWRAKFLHLLPSRTGWPSYTPRHWVCLRQLHIVT
jgi:hypothetical protein